MDHKYEEALERARKGMPIDEVFPELKESKDERIRKELIGHCQDLVRMNKGDEVLLSIYEPWIAYLERQKEQKPIEDVVKDITKNKETATRFLKSAGIMDENGELAEMYRSEQQPAEWSEEDKEKLDFVISVCIDAQRPSGCAEGSVYYNKLNEAQKWLKSLRPQPKQEWSEEDEKIYNKALDAIYYKDCNEKDDVISALNDLCDLISRKRKVIPPYAHWKPSEEHFQGLRRALKHVTRDSDAWNSLTDLYEHLQKLL